MVIEITATVHKAPTNKAKEVLFLLERRKILAHGTVTKHLEVHQDILADLQQDLVLEDTENRHFGVH